MPSLHKHSSDRSPYWFCKFRDFTGKVIVKSTKQTEKSDAMQVCLAWESASGGSLTETQARKVVNEILERTGQSKVNIIGVKIFFMNWLDGKELSKKPRTAERYKGVVLRFLKSLGVKSSNPLTSLTPREVETFRNELQAEGKASKTITIELKIIRTVLNAARRQGLLLTNPAEAVDLPKVVSHTKEAFEPEQITALLKVADEEWKTAILIGFFLGARISDVINLSWENVDLGKAVITYDQRKTGKRVVAPIHEDLENHLMAIADDRPKGLLCPSLNKRSVGGRSGLSRSFGNIIRDAGIDSLEVKGKGKKGRKFSKLSFHALRHSFTSVLANAGIPDEVRMKLTGHSSADIHAKYTHLQLAPLKAAIEKLPSVDPQGIRKNN